MNKKFIEILKKGGMAYLIYKITTSQFHWVKFPDGNYEWMYVVIDFDDPLSKNVMNSLLKLRDYGKKIIKD